MIVFKNAMVSIGPIFFKEDDPVWNVCSFIGRTNVTISGTRVCIPRVFSSPQSSTRQRCATKGDINASSSTANNTRPQLLNNAFLTFNLNIKRAYIHYSLHLVLKRE